MITSGLMDTMMLGARPRRDDPRPDARRAAPVVILPGRPGRRQRGELLRRHPQRPQVRLVPPDDMVGRA